MSENLEMNLGIIMDNRKDHVWNYHIRQQFNPPLTGEWTQVRCQWIEHGSCMSENTIDGLETDIIL